MASQIITLPTVTVTSGTAAAGTPVWDISDAVGVSLFANGSTSINVEVAFAASSDASFVPLLAPWRSHSTAAAATAFLATSSAAFTLDGLVAKQMRFISSGTVSAGFTVTGAKSVRV